MLPKKNMYKMLLIFESVYNSEAVLETDIKLSNEEQKLTCFSFVKNKTTKSAKLDVVG